MFERPIQLHWFFRLRVFAFVTQLVLLAAACLYFPVTLRMLSVVALALLIPLSQQLVPLFQRFGWSDGAQAAFFLIFDTMQLTAVLSLSGGPSNPFSIVYLLFVVLASVMLGRAWTWAVALFSSVCFGLLFLASPDTQHMHGSHSHQEFAAHLHGMLFSYCLVAAMVAYFLSRIIRELRRKEEHIQRLNAAQEKLLSVTALAANAAHELGTPLATIELVSHELKGSYDRRETLQPEELLEDLEILKGEASRCRGILDDICSHSGTMSGEPYSPVSLSEIRLAVQESLGPIGQRVEWKAVENEQRCHVPRRAVVVALKALIKNGIDATGESNEKVTVALELLDGSLKCLVQDRGCGISDESLKSLGEPFFTTKEGGMGLGVYLSQLIATQLGGTIQFSSQCGKGTRVTFQVPLESDVGVKAA